MVLEFSEILKEGSVVGIVSGVDRRAWSKLDARVARARFHLVH